MHLLFAFTKKFVFNVGQITEGEKQIANGIALVQKTLAFNEYLWEQKRRIKKYFDSKRIWKTQG